MMILREQMTDSCLQGLMRPELLGSDFTHLEFIRRPVRRDLGKRLLYRDAYMSGWSYKTVTMEDLKFPLVYGEGKRVSICLVLARRCDNDLNGTEPCLGYDWSHQRIW